LQQISDGVRQAAREFPIRKAELFGSYARGTATEDSDVDLLVYFDQPAVSLFKETLIHSFAPCRVFRRLVASKLALKD